MQIRDVMHGDIWAVGPEMAVSELGVELARRRISGAPVVDQNGQILGVVSLHDVAAAPDRTARPTAMWGHFWHMGMIDASLLDELSRETSTGVGQVRDIMTPACHLVGPMDSLHEATEIMVAHHIHRLLVVDQGCPVGIITSTDLMRVLRDMLKVTA